MTTKIMLRLRLLATALPAILISSATVVGSAATPTPDREALRSGGPSAISDSYVVVFKGASVSRAEVSSAAAELTRKHGGTVGHTYKHALRGFEAHMSEDTARQIATSPDVQYVQQNHRVKAFGTQVPVPSWGLDRVDQRALPRDNSFRYPNTASNVRAYIIDTGIRTTHLDFGGRATWGTNATDDGVDTDCHGHGTHVAGTVGGTLHGVAKGIALVAVKVLDCAGSGTTAGVIAGIDWVTGDHVAGSPAVANMSLGGGFSQAINDAVTNSIADGISYSVAAGNEYGSDACGVSPGSTPDAITVGSTAANDARSAFSNVGGCLDLFAPGSGIKSAWNTGDAATNTISGTSMATPHVAGAAALVYSANAGFTPQQVRDALVEQATPGMVSDVGEGSPNRLLYVTNEGSSQDFSIVTSPAAGTINAGGSVTTTVSTRTTVGAPQTVNLFVGGTPAGIAATFSPATITTGAGSTLTFDASAAVDPGTYVITVGGIGTTAITTTAYALTIIGPPGCRQTIATDLSIADRATTDTTMTISGCSGRASATSTVAVDILHTYVGELDASLIAPDGSAYRLHRRVGDDRNDLHNTYFVNLSGEKSNGVWRLRVRDGAAIDVGVIDSWTLDLAGGTTGCTGWNGTNSAIRNNATVTSAVVIGSRCGGQASTTSAVSVNIKHSFVGDLIVTLIAPDGSSYALHDRAGGSTDDIDQTYTVDLSGEAKSGTWTLRVQDSASLDTGHVDGWTLRT